MEHALYSEEHLLDILAAHAALKVQALVDMVMKSVRDYAGEATQSDDMTMLAIHYKPKSKDNGKRENIEQ